MSHTQLHTQGLLDLGEVPEFARNCRFDPFPPLLSHTAPVLHYSANILPDFWGRCAFHLYELSVIIVYPCDAILLDYNDR